MRKIHYISKNENTESPSNILVVDTEASILEKNSLQYQTLRLGCAIHISRKGEDYFESEPEVFNTVEQFWKILDNYDYPKSRLYIFAHNMAYDYTILKIDSYLSSRMKEIKMRVIDSVFVIRAGNMLFISTTNFYKKSLKELGKIFGNLKMESPDFKTVSTYDLTKYCIQDTKVLCRIVIKHIKFIREKDLGCFRPTLAGQSFTAFRHRFLKHKLLVHNFQDILNLEKNSYRGGRCEAFRIGSFRNIHYLDVNSMYPYVMMQNLFPIKPNFSRVTSDRTVDDILDSIKYGNFVIADCNLNLKLPVIACKRDKLIFPIGKIRQTITSPEIEFLINNPEYGSIELVNEMVSYSKGNIFEDFVKFFYFEVRLKADNDADRIMAKLILNSLYGKFGQHNSTIPEIVSDEKTIRMCEAVMSVTGSFEFQAETCKYVKVGDNYYKITKNDGDYSFDAMPCIASGVTSFARMTLQKMMIKAGLDNVFYCDTDSLFVNDNGLDNLKSEISKTELGKLKLEESGDVQIFGAKDYIFNDKVKLKGIKPDAEKLGENTYRQFHFHTKNIRYKNGTPDGIVIVEPVVKKLDRNYDKGTVIGDKVFPLILNEF